MLYQDFMCLNQNGINSEIWSSRNKFSCFLLRLTVDCKQNINLAYYIHNYLKDIFFNVEYLFLSTLTIQESYIPVIFYMYPTSFLNIIVLWSNTTQIVMGHICVIFSRRKLQVYQRSYSQVGHIPPKMSDSLQRNVRQIWESTLSKSDIVVGRESGYLKIFFTFLEVNMSNILWSMRICKRTFFPVCRMSGYVNTLVYFYLAPYSRQER